MHDIKVTLLQRADAGALLAFESANRAWFEQHIDARDDRFYSPAGIGAHIDDYLAQHAQGCWHPLLLRDGAGVIIGRANLKHIDSGAGTAEVGYRVAQSAAGRGVASLALQQLIVVATDQYGLTSLRAEVLQNNPASARILEKTGFQRGACVTGMAIVAGHLVNGEHYALELRRVGTPCPPAHPEHEQTPQQANPKP